MRMRGKKRKEGDRKEYYRRVEVGAYIYICEVMERRKIGLPPFSFVLCQAK